jgi:hypothetical protein
LVVQRHARVVVEWHGRFGGGASGRFLSHFLTLQISFKSIEEEAVVRDGKPVEDFLFFLGSNTVVLVEEIKEFRLRFLKRGVGAGFEISKIWEDPLFEFLGVYNGSTECEESIRQWTNDIRACDVEEIVPAGRLAHFARGTKEEGLPEHARNIFSCWQLVPSYYLIWLPVGGSCGEKVFDCLLIRMVWNEARMFVRWSTCSRASRAACGNLSCCSWDNRKVSGFWPVSSDMASDLGLVNRVRFQVPEEQMKRNVRLKSVPEAGWLVKGWSGGDGGEASVVPDYARNKDVGPRSVREMRGLP